MPAIASATPVQSIDINPVAALKYSRDFTDERENFRQHLIAALWLPQQLDIAMAKLDVIARPGSGGGSAKLVNEQNPISFAAYDAHEGLRAKLSTIVNDIQNCRGMRAGLKDNSTASLARFILSDHDDLSTNHVDWLYSSHMWELTYTGVLEVIAAALDAVDLPEYDEPSLDDLIRTVQAIPDYILDGYATAPKIVEGLKDRGVKNLTRNRIHAWADDKADELVPKYEKSINFVTGKKVLVPTYCLRDVCSLWLAAESKKQATRLKKQAAAERKAIRMAKKSDLVMAA